jgi:hypothetical protein
MISINSTKLSLLPSVIFQHRMCSGNNMLIREAVQALKKIEDR